MRTTVAIAGAGPAGLVLGLLLARQGIEVTVLEKHADFLRDFRGDTVHSSTLDLLDELGLGPKIAALPGHKAGQMKLTFADGQYTMADFTRLPGAHPFLLFLPQWEFLSMLATEAATLPTFTLLRSTEVTGLQRDGSGTVTGVTARGSGGEFSLTATLTVAADGRFSQVRAALGLHPAEHGAPMDVLWFRLPRHTGYTTGLDMRIGAGGLLLAIDRGDYFQNALVIAKGGLHTIHTAGLQTFRARISELAPHLGPRMQTITSWDSIKLLNVQVNRMSRWHGPGYLLIGDAAHAMSPIGGVGVNLAIQDAVATARLLGPPLRTGTLTTAALAAVQRRRRFPTAVTQLAQRIAQHQIISPVLASGQPINAPWPLRIMKQLPWLQGIPARMIGIGIRPEHLRTM
jgi:2-polyprenyl-6-methoxyphenol hydroxylase-like FAD-dependent oxidoreductase